MGCVWVYMQKVELRYWWEYGDEKTGLNYMNESDPRSDMHYLGSSENKA